MVDSLEKAGNKRIPIPGPGRPKGSKNKLPTEAKEAIALAFQGLGGVPALIEWASKPRNRSIFYAHIWTKLVPRNINISGEVRVVEELEAHILKARQRGGIDPACLERSQN